MAPPGPNTDRIWNELVNSKFHYVRKSITILTCSTIGGAMFALDADDFLLVNDHPDTGIKLSHDPNGRYVGTLAATHQIHCVVSICRSETIII